jgi:alcohol dehydrogenase
VRVLLSGICNTDLELLRGTTASGIPGHGSSGSSRGRHPPVPRQRVVGEINLACRRCAWCRRGAATAQRTVLGIVKRRRSRRVPDASGNNLHIVPAKIADEAAVFVEPLAAACEILDQVPVTRRTRAAVLGLGKLGTLCADVLENAGADVTRLSRGSRARPRSFDLVVEATGSPAGMPRRQLAAPRGRSSGVAPATTASFDAAPVVNEITIVGSRCGQFGPAGLCGAKSTSPAFCLPNPQPAPRALALAKTGFGRFSCVRPPAVSLAFRRVR